MISTLMQINPAGGLSQSEIDRIIKEASAFAEADHERREVAAIKNRLEGMIASNERVLAEFGGGLADDERQRIEETLSRSREIAGGESREAFNEAIFDMRLARDAGYTVVEQQIAREMLYIADEIFFTGTAAEITPIRSVDRITVGAGKRGPVTERIQKDFFAVIHGDAEDRHGWLMALPVEAAVR